MKIVEETRDRLRIEVRKTMPDLRYGIAVGLLFSMPLFIAYWNARTQNGAWKLLIVIAVIWLIVAAIYALVVRLSRPPVIDLDAKTRCVLVGGHEFSLDDISVVSTHIEGHGLIFYLLGGDSDFFPAKRTTAAEKSRAVQAIRKFLLTHRIESTADPYRETAPDHYVEPFEDANADEEDEVDGPADTRREAATRWTESWSAESTERRKCIYCEKRAGDAAPVRVWAEDKKLDVTERLYVPRCRRCARIHELHLRLAPGIALLLTWIAAVTFFMVKMTEWPHSAIALIAGFIGIAFGLPALAFALARIVTKPTLFGSRDIDAWRSLPVIQQRMREGWEFRSRWWDRL
jgi:hypothetical protein